ncbi:MAG: pirin family protein [Candidatus Thorarchaeota archaeon]
MAQERFIEKVWKSRPTMEGAGVRLNRAFGFYEVPLFDPFLLLDDFGSNNPDDYIRGFPWHPHRGIETITYMIAGEVQHGDSLGNRGAIGTGDVQWMTAGSGIIHEEMPRRQEGMMAGFQLWSNLPSADKMMHPRYRDIRSDAIPEVELGQSAKAKIIAGEINGVKGPVQDVVTDPEYLDVTVNPNSEFRHRVERDHTVFAYIFEGEAFFDVDRTKLCGLKNVILFGDGEEVVVTTEDEHVRFLLISGKPIREPVAWRGPIVMNTKEELQVAFEEYQNGTFIKHDRGE